MSPQTSAWIPLEAIPIAVRIVLAGSLLSACSATPASSSQPVASIPTDVSVTTTVTTTPETTAPSGPIAISEGPAPAGMYTTTSFKPAVMLRLPSDGWQFFFQDDNDEMALGKGEVELTGGRVANVIDPTTQGIVPAPDDLVWWLGSHPDLEAESAQPASVGGIVGQSIDVVNAGTGNVDIFAYPTGNLRVAAGTAARLWVLPYDGPDLVFTGFAPTSRFQEALPILQSVVDSIVITPS